MDEKLAKELATRTDEEVKEVLDAARSIYRMRLKRYLLDTQAMHNIFLCRGTFHVKNDIPEDATVVRVDQDPTRDCWSVIVSHHTFPLRGECEVIPEAEPAWITRIELPEEPQP